MTPILVAVAIGLAVGAARGGRPTLVHFNSWWLLIGGVGLQATNHQVLVAYALLAAFAVRNLARPGMGVLLIGVGLNAAPILLNGSMPVEAHAIVSARIATPAEVGTLSIGGRRHLAHGGDHIRALDDTIPDWWSHEVLSFGDIVIAVGVGAIVAGLLRQPRETSQRS
ncbi:MAG: DUF5317 family protein, partial [Acidimicrobiales bacterium]